MTLARYDCKSAQTPGAYAELFIADSKVSAKALKAYRDSDYQAITFARFKQPPLTEAACEANGHGTSLRMMISGALRLDAPCRYDRIIIVRRGTSDDTHGLVAFLRHWFPTFVKEKRVFVSRVAGRAAISRCACERVLGPGRVIADAD